jgi:predicted dehydrogenase
MDEMKENSTMKRIRVGVIGFGWMGRAHSRSLRRIPMVFPDRGLSPQLVACADADGRARQVAREGFGFERVTSDWREVISSDDVEVVYVAAPNMLHVEMITAAAAAGKDVFCEKPVGGTPAQTLAALEATKREGVLSGVGYNYRWAPLVQEARLIVASGELGDITNYRGRFLSMYGSNPLGLLTWRYLVSEGGYGVTSDLLSHAVDLAEYLLGPMTSLVAQTATFITHRPLPTSQSSHYLMGHEGDPTGEVTNEDYVGFLSIFANGARGTFESSRTMVGPESQMAFEIYGTKGALAWNFERMNELQYYRLDDGRHAGYRTIYAGERFAYHGNFVPGSANGIGFEDLVTIEDLEFMDAVAQRREFHPDFNDALRFSSVQAAILRSSSNGRWEQIGSVDVP